MCSTRFAIGALLLAALSLQPALAAGDWAVLTPMTIGEGSDAFSGIDGTSLNDVWAVGVWQNPYVYKSLIQHFDGTSWTKLPAPDTGSAEQLADVLAVSSHSAVAVGSHIAGVSTSQPLAMEWDGSAWALIATPVFEGGARFSAIDRSPAGTIWVAGYQYGTAFLARRTAADWEVLYAPHVGGGRNNFEDLDAHTDSEIWAVGTRSDRMGQRMLLIQRYDGNGSWTTFDIPSPGGIDRFNGVRAFAADDVWAVGYYYDRTLFLDQPMIMHFDGAGWTRAQTPLVPGGSAVLESVTATAPDDIDAAGTYSPTGGIQRAFMLHYDGVSWTEVSLPATGGSYEWLLGLGTTPEGETWAVGQYYDGTTTEPIAYVKEAAATAVGDPPKPVRFALSSSPNPFADATSVRFVLDRPGSVRVQVWDAAGRLVRSVADRQLAAGPQVLHWDGLDADGYAVAAGVYFLDLSVMGRQVERQKLIRLR